MNVLNNRETKVLREYQLNAINHIEAFKGTRLGVQLPTGTGKTFTIRKFIERNPNKRIAFIGDSKMLIDQTMRAFEGLNPQRVQGACKYNENANLFVSTRQTLVNRDIGKLDYIIFDEYHRYGRGLQANKIVENTGNPIMLGLSATLYTPNGEPLAIFDEIYEPKKPKYFIENGYLKNLIIKSPATPDLSKTTIRNGDYVENKELVKAMLAEDIAKITAKDMKGKTTVVFAVTIYHANKLARDYKKLGFKVGVVHSNKKDVENKKVLRDLELGLLEVVVSVTSLTAGFDNPKVDCVVIARPTQSIPLYIQMVGRGMRKYKDTEDCLLLDCGNCAVRLGDPTDDVKPIEPNIRVRRCSSCNSVQVTTIDFELKEDMTFHETVKCYACGAEETKEKQKKNNICPSCKMYVPKKLSKVTEDEDSYIFSTECPHCRRENVYNTIPKIKGPIFRDLNEIEVEIERLYRVVTLLKSNSIDVVKEERKLTALLVERREHPEFNPYPNKVLG